MSAGVLRASMLSDSDEFGRRSRYGFNGVDQYVTIPEWETLGDAAIYEEISYKANTEDDFVFEATRPLIEFGRVGSDYHEGNLSVVLGDNSPIQDTDVVMGNGSRYATFNTTITLSSDFVIEFDWIRFDGSASNNQAQVILGDNANLKDCLRFYDSAHVTFPSGLSIIGVGGSKTWSGITAGIAQGKHVRVRIARVGGTTSVYFNGALADSTGSNIGTLNIDTMLIDSDRSSQPFRAGSAVQNMAISAGVNSVFYPMNEGVGAVITNTDPALGSAFNATWTEAEWTRVPSNSRKYAVDEGGYSRLYDSVGRRNGSIENFLPGGWSVQKIISATNVFKSAFDLTNASNAGYYDFDFDSTGQYMYTARGTAGIAIFDISDIENENVTLVGNNKRNSWRYQNVKRIGEYLYSVSRLGSGVTVPGGGSLERWDISDPSNPVLDTKGGTVDGYYETYHLTDLALFSRYSALGSDGTSIFVFGQHHGVFKFPISNIEGGPTDATGYTGAETATDHETQGGTVSGGRVYEANYGINNGSAQDIRIFDADDLTIELGSIPRFTDTVVQRAWEIMVRGNAMYSSHNSTDTNPETRGLLVQDINNIALDQAHTDYLVYPLADVSPAQTSGDTPDTGMALFGNWLLIGHGGAGVAVYDVSRPLFPVYKGLINNLEGIDTVFAVNGFRSGGKDYIVYADGQQAIGDGTRKVYIDELTAAASVTEFTIGLTDYAGSVGIAFPTKTRTVSAGIGPDRQYTAVAGDTITHAVARIDNPGARVARVGLYESVAGTPTNLVMSQVITTTAGIATFVVALDGGPFALTAGQEYTAAMIQDTTSLGSSISVVDANGSSGLSNVRDTPAVSGVLDATWSTASSNSDDPWVGFLGTAGA